MMHTEDVSRAFAEGIATECRGSAACRLTYGEKEATAVGNNFLGPSFAQLEFGRSLVHQVGTGRN